MTVTDNPRGRTGYDGPGAGPGKGAPGAGAGPVEFDRTPPHDIAAEQSALGGMLLSKDAIADVVEVLRAPDFYRPAHGSVYDVIGDLYGRGEPADVISVAAELGKRELLERVGGPGYLHTLISSVPTAANAGYYARIVAEKAVLRRLAEAGTRIVQLAYSAAADVDDLVDRAQAAVYDVTDRRTTEDYAVLGDLLNPTLEEIEAIEGHDGSLSGVPTGFADLDELTNGLHGGQLWIIAARPAVGKSTLGLDLARAAAIKNSMTAAVFSLEMSRLEITMRLLSAEARVSLQSMRTGRLSEDDWARLARRMGEVAEAPLFIDDSPNLTMMEIRAKARRLKQRDNLRLIILDYLQLMSSPKRVESRQQEVSELSRSLKLLAKELDVPVIAISQLNRASEQRADKRPQLSDLRECLTGDTLITRADTGQRIPIAELVDQRDIPVWTLDDRLRLCRGTMSEVWRTGVRPVHRITLASGRTITATANHPLRTLNGWTPVEELRVGESLAVARAVPAPAEPDPWDSDEVIFLAHIVGDGCVTRSPVYYCSRDDANLDVVADAAVRAFGVGTRRTPGRGVTYLHFPMVGRAARGVTSPLYDWLRCYGLYGKNASQKRLPARVHTLDDEGVALLLRHLWATDGSVTVRKAGGRVRIYYASTSRELADDVQALLLRLGIGARLRSQRCVAEYRKMWTVDVSGRTDQIEFLTSIGVHGERGQRGREAAAALAGRDSNPNVDVIPHEVWNSVRTAMAGAGVTSRASAGHLAMSYCGSALYKSGQSRERMSRVAVAVADRALADLATSDVRWDRIVSIEPAGEAEVFDASVPGTHSFLANDVVSHNSGAIEQDADAVILLYREDAVEKESARAGEADLIVAKHRNGPTGTITVAFQGHYSRFVDMAPQ